MPQNPWTLVQPAEPTQPSGWTLVQPAADTWAFGDRSKLPTKPAATEDYLPTPKSTIENAWDTVKGLGRSTVGQIPGLVSAVSDLAISSVSRPAAERTVARVKGLGTAHVEQFEKAKSAFDSGMAKVRAIKGAPTADQAADIERTFAEAIAHVGGGVIPLLGPAAAAIGEKAETDPYGALGEGGGLVASVLAPAAIRPGARVPGIGAVPDAAVQRAIATGQAAGVPIDAATATGNAFVQGVQKLADESLLGSVVGRRARTAQQAGLATMGEQLAAKAHPTRVTAGTAGEAAQQGLRDVVSARRVEANTAYDRLRAMEAAPENMTTIEPVVPPARPDAPFSFTMKPNASVDEIFSEALKDARESGYTGKVSDLRAIFDKRVQQARSLKAATAEGDEYSHAALLKEIRERGGLRPYEKDFRAGAPTRHLREEAQVGQQAVQNYYGKNAVYRNDGLATDDMLQQLSEDPKWGAVITPDTDLHELIRSGSMQSKANTNLEGYLRGAGVAPGHAWWMEGQPAQQVPMAVDISETKAAMRPVYDKLAAEAKLVPFMSGSGKARAFVALDRIMNGPDVAPLSVADAALSDLKAMARTTNPDLRTVGQGIAAKAVSNLHKAVTEAAERAGPDVVSALEEGRTATKAKYAAADILKRIEGARGTKSPVSALRGLAADEDTGIGTLRDVLKEAPQTKPLIGRAVLDRIVNSERMGPDAKLTAWQRIGPETKSALYAPEHVRALDDYFLLAKKIAENPNRSGSGTILSKALELTGKPAITLTAPMVSALLHSPAGVRLLTRGFRLPSTSTVARGAYVSALSKALQDAGQPAPTLAPAYASDRQQ